MLGPFKPAKARASLPKDIEDPNWIGEEKLDGSHYVLYYGYDPYQRHAGSALLSLTHSAADGLYVDKYLNVPHILPQSSIGITAVLDGEITAPKDFGQTVSIMNSSPETSLALQHAQGKLVFNAFDILALVHSDFRDFPEHKRRGYLENFVAYIDNPFIKVIPQHEENRQELYDTVVAHGGEGIILKDRNAVYGKGWAKKKKRYDVSVIISGFAPGMGKYVGQIGSLLCSVWDGSVLREIAKVSGMDDAFRQELTDNFYSTYSGKVIDIWFQETTKHRRLRHPTFFRMRPDVAFADCTWENVLEAMKSKKGDS